MSFYQHQLKERAIGRKAIGLPAFLAFRALAVAAGNAGFASFIVGMLSRALAPRLTPILASLPSFAFTLGAVLIPSSLAASFLMPKRTALVRDVRGEDESPLAPQVALVLVVLFALAMLQVPGVLSWWRAERAVLQGVLPERPDDLGFNYIPMAIAYGLPVVAALTIALFVITSSLAIVAPSKLSWRVIGSGVLLQLAYVAAAFIVIRELRILDAALAPLLADDPTAARQVAEWISRHDAAASAASERAALTCFGYVVAALVAYSSRAAVNTDLVFQPPIEHPVTTPARTELPAESHALPVSTPVSATSVVFDESNYSVHPRLTLFESWFTRVCTNFEIRTIPHRTRRWFSFSWETGALCQEPGGMELLRLTPAKAPGLFLSRTYEVAQPGTGETIAKFTPRGADWEIEDAHGNIAARILSNRGTFDFVKYRAFVGQTEACTFKWTLAGFSTSAAQLEIVFADASAAPAHLDRGLVVAIAPILEQQARIANEPRN